MMFSTTPQPSTFTNTLYHTPKISNHASVIAELPYQTSSVTGLRRLRSEGFINIVTSANNYPEQDQISKHGTRLFIPRRQYDNAVLLLTNFIQFLQQKRPGANPILAWIYPKNSIFIPYPPALASRGICLDNLVFLEAKAPLRTLQSVCEDEFFDGILFDDNASPKSLSLANRWLKPTNQPAVFTGKEISKFEVNKLFIFMD